MGDWMHVCPLDSATPRAILALTVSVAVFNRYADQPMSVHTRDRRTRHTFWIDDRVIDDFGPVMGRYPFGAAALAVYAVLARRADREGDSWPSLELIAAESGASARTVQQGAPLARAPRTGRDRLCYEQGIATARRAISTRC